jgi:aminoglycoside 3-N-acetyltransferase/aminoglycoside 3-N-acetyltransferase-2
LIDVKSLVSDLRALGLRPGDLLMVHASLRRIGPVEGGAEAVLSALLEALGPGGTVMAYVSWDRSPYEETLNGSQLSAAAKAEWPAFDPATAAPYPGWGYLNTVICRHPHVKRSGHPDASMAAIGPLADALVSDHPLQSAYGPGSPLERFIQRGGKVLLLGAPLDAVTVLHYSEAIAEIPNKRRVRLEMPILAPQGEKVWVPIEDWDSNGITDRFAAAMACGGMDAVETIARAYVMLDRHAEGHVGQAWCYLVDAQDIARFGVAYLERHADA